MWGALGPVLACVGGEKSEGFLDEVRSDQAYEWTF
jgi:hypothetical protein